MEITIRICALIGVISVGGILIAILCLIEMKLNEYFRRKKIKYIQKHRFDKPPTARCYCIDCQSWNKYAQECRAHKGWYTADNWFCWSAYPRVNEEDYEEY